MNELQSLRKQTGLSQSKFAEKYQISVRTLQQWEQGVSSPPDHTVKMLRRLMAYDDLLVKQFSLDAYRLKPKRTFKICIDDPYTNCERTYPIQQRKIKALIMDITANIKPSKIIIFGSSVTESCHIGSDVDIYAELPYECRPISGVYDFDYDFWSNYTVDDRLYTEIMKKGVLVYG